MDQGRPQLDYATHAKRPIEPWQSTRAAAVALIVICSLLAGGLAMLSWMAANGAVND